MRLSKLSTVLVAALLAACAGRYVVRPELVYAAPGVQVIADYDEPIFYADNFYWRFSGDTWYRSTYYGGGWTYAPPPIAIRQIERPREYAHYRPSGWVARREIAAPAPVVREQRAPQPRYQPRPVEPNRVVAPPPPVVAPQRRPPPEPVQVQRPRTAPRPQGLPPGQGGPHDRGHR